MPKKKPSTVELTIAPAIDFIKRIQSGKTIIAYGHDNDTICSAVVMQRLLKDFKGIDADLLPLKDNFAFSDADLEAAEKSRAEYVIVVDIAHVGSKKVEKFLASKKTLFIDHHQPLKLKGVTYCNPRMHEKGVYMPVSYLVYKLYESFGYPTKVAWIAGVGVLSDHGVAAAKDLFDYIKKIDPKLTGEKAEDEEQLFAYSVLGRLAKVLDNARVVKGKEGAAFAARTLSRVRSYNSILNAGSEDTAKLREWNDAAEKEFRRLVADFNRKRRLIKRNIIFYEIPSDMNIKSSLSGYLVQFCPDNVLVLAQQKGENFDFSFRRGRNDGTDLNKLSKRAVKGIPGGEGGGHEAASGARIPVSYLPRFLKQL